MSKTFLSSQKHKNVAAVTGCYPVWGMHVGQCLSAMSSDGKSLTEPMAGQSSFLH